jgi:hypothetical protein
MLRYTTRSVRRASGLVLVGYTEVIQDGHRADQYPGSRPVFRNSDRASTPGYRDPGAFHRTTVEFGKTLVAERIGLKATGKPRVT